MCSICFIHPSLSPSITQTEWLCCLSLAGHRGGHCRWTGWTSSPRVARFSITVAHETPSVSKASGSRLPWCPTVKATMPHHTGELTCSRHLLQAGHGLRRSPDVGVTSACLTSPSLDFPVCKPETIRFWSLHFSKPQVHPQEVGSGHSLSQGLGGCAVSVWSSLPPVYSSGNVPEFWCLPSASWMDPGSVAGGGGPGTSGCRSPVELDGSVAQLRPPMLCHLSPAPVPTGPVCFLERREESVKSPS